MLQSKLKTFVCLVTELSINIAKFAPVAKPAWAQRKVKPKVCNHLKYFLHITVNNNY